jgi:hypothetical protein
VIQYSRAFDISCTAVITGYSAFAEYDGLLWSGALPDHHDPLQS